MAGDGFKHQGHVADGTSKRPDVVERGCKRHQTVPRNSPVCPHHPDNIAERRRLSDGTASIRTQRDRGELRGDGCCGTAAGASGHASQIVWVVGRIETGVFRGRSHGEFVAIRLAQNNRAGSFEPLDCRGIVRSDKILQDSRGAGGAETPRQDDVLDGDGYAGKRRKRFACSDLLIHPLRLRERAFGAHAQVGADVLVLLLDARQMGRSNFDGGRPPAPQQFLNLAYGQSSQFHLR